ncbi:MAG: stage V sporulation protein SpoVM [Tepidanaerobacter acetatoxydans]|nr:stage V sporulation protein SpoVM [Tepidanaerobacter acetatoxydans]
MGGFCVTLNGERGGLMRIYVLKLPKTLSKFVKAVLGLFGQEK